MSEFDKRLADSLAKGNYPAQETGFYREMFSSFQGPEKSMFIMTWIGILIWGGLLIYCVIMFFQTEIFAEKLFYAAGAILLNSAQIALKLWYNMRLNRQAILREIRELRLEIAEAKALN